MTLQSLGTILLSFGLTCIVSVGTSPRAQASGKVEMKQGPEVSDTLRPLGEMVCFARPVNPDQFLIRPGDEIVVTFINSSLPPLSTTVNPEGKLVHPNLGVFDLSHTTLSQARALMLEPLSRQYNASDIDISIARPHLVDITVSGAVQTPGNYRAYNSERVSDIIEMAGGVTEGGSLRNIRLTGGPTAAAVDLERARCLGDDQADPYLYAGNQIHVPARSADLVQVTGEVLHPREIELLPQDNLDLLLALAGGPTRNGDTSATYVLGQGAARPDDARAIKSGMVLCVPRRVQTGPGSAFIFGQVVKPGRYDIESSATVAQLIQKAGGLTVDANPGRITLFRSPSAYEGGIPPSGRYPIAGLGATSSGAVDLIVRADDSLFVPQLLTFVKVSGLVRQPGLYPYVAGKSAQHYIDMAGGFASGANTSAVSIYDRVSQISSRQSPTVTVADGDEVSAVSEADSR